METIDKPTKKFYGLFQFIFDHYNDHLFESRIKDCLIVITRQKHVAGHYAHNRWFHRDDNETDELALNPQMFLRFPLIDICQTMVHEMCHAWQHHFGCPGRPGYHNKEWAAKMMDIGLMPTSNGKKGGKVTGVSMSDYPIGDGQFLQVSEELMNSEVFAGLYYEVNPNIFNNMDGDLPLFDQIKDMALAQVPQVKSKRGKVKYSCGCSNVWGKPGLALHCLSCDSDMAV